MEEVLGGVAVVGLLLGAAVAVALSRVAARVIVGGDPSNPWVYLAVGAVIFVLALAACWIPALRASRVDPVTALRYE